MKVILTGCTGFVGGEVLYQCLKNPAISSVIVLSRRQLPTSVANHPKMTVKIMENFLSYPDALMGDLQGAEACIWTLGKPFMSNPDDYRKMSIDFTIAAVKAFDKRLTPTKIRANSQTEEQRGKFRFIYCSGAATERDQNRSLWLAGDVRRIRGQVENELIAYGNDHAGTIETYILRPAMILPKQFGVRRLVFGLGPSIQVDTLASVMIEIAFKGSQDQIVENKMIVG